MSKKKNPIFIILLIVIIILAISFSICFFWWTNVQKPVNSTDQNEIQIVIPKGSGIIAIANILYEKKLIKNVLAFRLLVKKENIDSKIQAGSFHLSPNLTLAEIAQKLTAGREDFWVTIPEGKRREEIAAIFAKEYQSQSLEFSLADFLEASENLEGYLFPDSYLIPKTMTETEIVSLMRNTFDQKIPDEKKVESSKHNLNFHDVLVLASLVEREAKFDEDRPKIAAVLLNRLNIDMALQIDATVQYAVGTLSCESKIGLVCDWWPVISNTKINSPYNTYQNPGLPPGPICSPGLESIEAVLNPDQHNYLYYLSESSGITHYSETLEGHENNIAKYLE